nr:hypothetical protein [Enterococcus innesii]
MSRLLGGKDQNKKTTRNNEYKEDFIPQEPYSGFSEEIEKNI